jgi:hypothetical protein
MAYDQCSDVSQEIWRDLKSREPQEICGRTGVVYQGGRYHLPFLGRTLHLDPVGRQVEIAGAPGAEPGFRLCLTALMYLMHANPALLGPAISPLELPGGATFFRGPHGLPTGPLEERFGRDAAGFEAAGKKLQGEARPAGDVAVALQVFPGLVVEVILWQADEEFPAQVSFTLPAHLDRFWFLDAVWGLLNLVTQEMLQAAPRKSA